MADFSSPKYDEFSPVYYKNGIVFCSNRATNSLFSYYNSRGNGQYKIYYIDTTSNVTWKKARLFSKRLTSRFNDGPVTFSKNTDTVYFSRNLRIKGQLGKNNNSRNKLGIFSSELSGKSWSEAREIRFNNDWYNISTPCLSPDGKTLFFASDKPGGYGGSDLYSSRWMGGYWDDPVNLGPEINTSGNEAFPYMNSEGELFFSSDDHKGLGGKDIFVTMNIGGKWMPPAHLDPPVNSKYDDFGLITDSLMTEGYFSSNRNKSIDIYHFRTVIPQIFFATLQKENTYCFQFTDSGSMVIDTLSLRYVWSFGDGQKAYGHKVRHCFKGPGNYAIRLDLIDKMSGNLFFTKLSYNLILKDYEQAYINSGSVAFKGESLNFDGIKSNLPGYDVLNYIWDFGDGERMQGETSSHSFKDPGEYRVTLGLTIRSAANNDIQKVAVSKNIIVFKTDEEKETYIAGLKGKKTSLPRIEKYENARFTNLYSTESELLKDGVFEIELLNSKTRVPVRNTLFSNLPESFRVKEIFDPKESVYRYVTDEQMTLMQTLSGFRQIFLSGNKSAHVIIEPVEDGAPKELYSLKKIFGNSLDIYFDKSSRLTSEAYLILDQLYKIMNKYNSAKLEIAVHTDDPGLPAEKIRQSQQYSQIIATYLANKGLDHSRLIVTGFGSSAAAATDMTETGRVSNRRIDFSIIK